ncbi:MAG: Rab family GTPase [Candidatus Helarchaeota archaeon]
MVDKVLNGIVYSTFDEKVGPEALAWYPKEINSDIRNLVSLKTINVLSGEKGKVSKILAMIPFPSLNLKGLVRSFEIKNIKRRGGSQDASLTILFDEAMDLIYYKYLKHIEPLIEEATQNIKKTEETTANTQEIAIIIKKLYHDFLNALNELRDAEIFAQDTEAFSKESYEKNQTKGYRFKIAVCGDPAVGKTSIILRFTDRAFRRTYIPTMGVNISEKRVNYKDAKIEFIIWDIAGQNKFSRMRKHFYTGADGQILVFDLTNLETLKNIQKWYDDIKRFLNEDIKGILIGNKNDLIENRNKNKESIENMARSLNLAYIETSALTGENINEAFYKLAEILYMYSQEKECVN